MSQPKRRSWIPLFGYALAIVCLVWVYQGFDWKRELPKLRSMAWWWVVAAIGADLAVYLCQGWRWSVLLRPLAYVPPWKSAQAVYIGLFANEILPLRSGEIIRCYLQQRWTRLPLSVVFSSAVIERLIDGAWLIMAFAAVSSTLELPGWFHRMAQVLTAVLVIAAVLAGLAMVYRKSANAMVSNSRWARVLHGVLDGVHVMGTPQSFAMTVAISALYLTLQVLPIYFLMRGYGLALGPGAAAVVFLVLRMGTIIPNAPGNVGTFQFLTVAGLGLCGIGKADATGFATVLFLVITVPLLMGGFVALLATKMRLEEIHRDAHQTFAAQ